MKRQLFVLGGLAIASGAFAADFQIDIHSDYNANILGYTNGGNYQVGNTFLNAGGVNFYLGVLPVDVASTAVVQVGGSGDETHTFATNIAVGSGATLYTLINSAFGGAGSDLGYVQVTGAGGETASLELIEGFNVRDHNQDGFENNLSDPTVLPTYFSGGAPSASGPVRLDRQELVLPSSFANDTITSFTFFGHDLGGNGQPFLAAATVQTTPEPATLAVLGLGALAAIRKRRS